MLLVQCTCWCRSLSKSQLDKKSNKVGLLYRCLYIKIVGSVDLFRNNRFERATLYGRRVGLLLTDGRTGSRYLVVLAKFLTRDSRKFPTTNSYPKTFYSVC